MASTSVPQQGSLSTEAINQLGTLDGTQLSQLIRNLPSLLKVSYCPPDDPSCFALSLAMRSTSAICGFGSRCCAIASGCVQ